MHTTITPIRSVLTRTCGFLKTICSHSLQPYRGCPFGKSLCGVGCYVRHNAYVTRGREWGSFLDVRPNAAEMYLKSYDRERAWARKTRGSFVIFLSSSTEPFPPQEARHAVTRGVLEAMIKRPPDGLIVQTHSPAITKVIDVLTPLARECDLRCHISIESDRDRLPGLPAPAASVAARFEAATALKAAGLKVVITVAPLLPIADPDRFFARVADAADAVVLDHFIGGDGSPLGTRTLRTALPAAMAAVDPDSVHLSYRTRMGEIAERHLPGRVGYHIDGFAGLWSMPPRSDR
jgi:DNA repair photolyase